MKGLTKKVVSLVSATALMGSMMLCESNGKIVNAATGDSIIYGQAMLDEYFLEHGRTYYNSNGCVLPWTNSGVTFEFTEPVQQQILQQELFLILMKHV